MHHSSSSDHDFFAYQFVRRPWGSLRAGFGMVIIIRAGFCQLLSFMSHIPIAAIHLAAICYIRYPISISITSEGEFPSNHSKILNFFRHRTSTILGRFGNFPSLLLECAYIYMGQIWRLSTHKEGIKQIGLAIWQYPRPHATTRLFLALV
jgi:hypothetical protein